jgi:hypothetical protein
VEAFGEKNHYAGNCAAFRMGRIPSLVERAGRSAGWSELYQILCAHSRSCSTRRRSAMAGGAATAVMVLRVQDAGWQGDIRGISSVAPSIAVGPFAQMI